MARPQPIGIDLGTTFSAVAWVDEQGRSAMLPNAEGDLLTPSVVLFADSEIVVGKEACSAATVHPDWVAQWVKRDMGAPAYGRPIRGKHLPPEVIQACILRKLRADVVDRLGPEAQVVITVPAYFDEPRRNATADAGQMAGLSVLDIVNEPTAAALAFGEALGYLTPTGEPKEELTVLVYDLGGGTFDATLLRLASGHVETIATDGDVQLGGYDWDWRLVDHVADAFETLHGIDPRRDPAGLNRLLGTVTEAKHVLSVRQRASIRVEHQGRVLDLEVTRDQFNQLTADLLERTAFTVRQLLIDAGLRWKDVSRVLLVGGSTRMPQVAEMLEQTSRLKPDRSVAPDEAVARGAALYASHRLADGAGVPTFKVTNVNSHSLGVEGIDRDTLRKTNVVLIKRNTPLPARFTESFTTKAEGQRSIVVQVLEGESPLPGECTAIGRTVVHDLPPGLPKAWPVEVTFEYAANGRVSVRAVVPGTGRETAVNLERSVALPPERLDRWTAAVTCTDGFGAFAPIPADGPVAAEPDGLTLAPEDEPDMLELADPAVPDPAPAAEGTRLAADVARMPSARRSWHGVFLLAGYLSSAAAGLGLGYLVLRLLARRWPDVFHLPW